MEKFRKYLFFLCLFLLANMAWTQVTPNIQINEIMLFPEVGENEWVELYNPTSSSIDISNYRLSNSTNIVYTLPQDLPAMPPGAYALIIFDGESGEGDDRSFFYDNKITLHTNTTDVFGDSKDCCALYRSGGSNQLEMIGFTIWGNSTKISEYDVVLLQAIEAELVNEGYLGPRVAETDLIGPAQILLQAGSLVISGSVYAPVKPGQVTPGYANQLPTPDLHLPLNNLKTSADLFTFSWVESDRGTYQFQLARDAAFNDIIIDQPGLESPRYRPSAAMPRNITLYWRIRIEFPEGNSPWSETRTFGAVYDNTFGGGETEVAGGGGLGDNPLGVPAMAARKDSELLCVNGCDAAHWDSSNEGGPQHSHSTWYCWATAAQMISLYRGGTVLKDEIVVVTKGDLASPTQPFPNIPHGIIPEDSLPHGGRAGAMEWEIRIALGYALQATNAQLHETIIKPTQAEIISYIDNDQPIYYCTSGHAMIIDGYRTTDGDFQARFLNTDNDGTVEWWKYSDVIFRWAAIPEVTLTGRIRDPRLALDFDGDGVKDLDEIERFPTKGNLADSDSDGVTDKADIASYALRRISADIDGDGLRGEMDPDSDNGGVLDGDEDIDKDGEYEPGNGEGDPQDISDDALSIRVFVKDESFGATDWIKPRIYIENIGTSSLSNFSIEYYFRSEWGTTPMIEDWHTPEASVTLVNISGNDYKVVYNFNGVTLNPGWILPHNEGNMIGIRDVNWTPQNKANDYSQGYNEFKLSTNVTVLNSANVVIYGSSPTPITTDLSGTYRITPQCAPDSSIDLAGPVLDNGANIQIWTYAGNNNQQWVLNRVVGNIYTINSVYSGKYLARDWGNSTNGTNIQQWEADGTDSQKWIILDAGYGYYKFIGLGTNKVLDIDSADSFDGNNLQIYDYNGTNAQKFKLEIP